RGLWRVDGGRKIGRIRSTTHVHISLDIQSNARSSLTLAAPQKSGPDQGIRSRVRSVELGDKGVTISGAAAAGAVGLEGILRGERARAREAAYINVGRVTYRDAVVYLTKIGGVDQRFRSVFGWINSSDETIAAARASHLV